MEVDTKSGEFWAIVELMGHLRIAGKVSPSPLCPGTLIRVDVPAVEGVQAFTKLISQSAIYALTVTDEETARAMVTYEQPRAMDAWTIKQAMAALPGPVAAGTPDDDDGGDPQDPIDDEPDEERVTF